MEALTITRHGSDHAGEYHAHIEGSDHIGRLIWTQRGNIRSADSTQVPPELGGKGIAGKLVEALMADATAQGFKVKPACSYVAKAFEKHPEWEALKA